MATAELSKTQVIHHDGQITSPEQIQTGEVYRRVGKLNTGLPAGRTLFIPLNTPFQDLETSDTLQECFIVPDNGNPPLLGRLSLAECGVVSYGGGWSNEYLFLIPIERDSYRYYVDGYALGHVEGFQLPQEFLDDALKTPDRLRGALNLMYFQRACTTTLRTGSNIDAWTDLMLLTEARNLDHAGRLATAKVFMERMLQRADNTTPTVFFQGSRDMLGKELLKGLGSYFPNF